MKVGIDTFGCNHGKSGIGSYLDSLTENLHNDEEFEFELFGAEIDRYTFGANNGFKYAAVALPDSRKIKRIWHYTCVNFFAKKRNPQGATECPLGKKNTKSFEGFLRELFQKFP